MKGKDPILFENSCLKEPIYVVWASIHFQLRLENTITSFYSYSSVDKLF